MPTIVTRYLNTGSSAGGDGTTNATAGANRAWATLEEARAQLIAAYPSLITADVQVDLFCSGATDDTTAVTNTWPTSDATRHIHIQVPEADRKVAYDANVYTIIRNPSTPVVTITTNSMRATGIQVINSATLDLGGNHGISINGSGSGGIWELDTVKCYKANNAGQVAFLIGDVAGTYVFRNCVSGGDATGFRFRAGIAIGAGPSNTIIIAYNNTIQLSGVSTGISIIFAGGGSNKVARVKNNLIQNSTNGVVVTNATTDDQATNHHSTGTDATFVDAPNGDFRLTVADTVARNKGTNLSVVSDWPFVVDGDLTARPVGTAWDIGAHEQLVPDVQPTTYTMIFD